MIAQYSFWFIFLCLLLGVGYAVLLYVRTPLPELPLWVKRVAFVLRAICVTAIAFLLLNPIIRKTSKDIEKPIVLIGVDNSQSIVTGSKSNYYKGDFKEKLQQITQKLEDKFTVETFLVGDSLRLKDANNKLDFSDETSHLSAFFEQINSTYASRNVGAVVLFSDGIFNVGNDPYYAANRLKAPVYSVLMGDTIQHKDLLISKVNYNKTVYRNSFFPLEILIKADKLAGQSTTLKVYHKDDLIFEKKLTINTHSYLQWERLNFEAKESGLHRYRIEIEPITGEITTANNRKDIFIEVIDQRKKIAFIYNAPHPDISAIRQSIEAMDMYQTEAFEVSKFTGKLADYDIVVLHGLPSRTNPAATLTAQIQKLNMPCFYVLGEQTDYGLFNQLNAGLQVLPSNNMKNDAFPLYNQGFGNFLLSEASKQLFSVLPPIKVPFGNFKLSPATNVLLYQKINGISTNYPLFVYCQNQERKTAIFAGDGLWRWRLHNFLYTQHQDEFDELVSKTMQYLSTKADRSLFRVTGKNVFSESENIRFDAQLFNDNYELVNQPEVEMQIKSAGKQYSFIFTRTFNAYTLDAGLFPQGDYSWTANTVYNGVKHTKSGFFSVHQLNIEALNLVANHQLLFNLASLNNGQSFADNDLDNLCNTLENNTNIKSVVHYNKKHTSLLNSIWLLVSIFVLLAAEWGLRKWSGGY
ncbi:MAG: hypothetical protein LBR36_07105 [Bacteroidales bacterium]|jgi:hypothetical protein|nr:hypothetical protein [Bacteroidales bacterium]